jgi:hypothetical protein
MAGAGRAPWWDATAAHRIARENYGSMLAMFEAHGWPERGTKMMPVLSSHIVAQWGGIAAALAAHGLETHEKDQQPPG